MAIKELEAMIKSKKDKIEALKKTMCIVDRQQTIDQIIIEMEMISREIWTIEEIIMKIKYLQETNMSD